MPIVPFGMGFPLGSPMLLSFSSFHLYRLGRSAFFVPPSGRSQRLPEMNRRPPPKSLTVRLQWFSHRPQRGFDRVAEMGKHVHANQRGFSGTVVLACSAAPYAPIRPEIAGRVTSRPISCSNERRMASLRKVPPCTTMCWPRSSGE